MADRVPNERLAIHGGPRAVMEIEGKPRPRIGAEEFMALARRFGFSEDTLEKIQALVDGEDLGDGPRLEAYRLPKTSRAALEGLVREIFGVRYALAVSSGTAALNCAFAAVGVGPGTEVICPAIGFYATAAEVVHAKGIPVFCDVDASLGMDPDRIEAAITPRTVAIAPAHVMGSVCRMDAIVEIARRHGLRVVEDCAQSCGGKYHGRYAGTFGDVGCFSISVYKIVGGGEGGLLLTDDERLWERANQLAECGGLWRPDRFAPPRYEGELFNGTNYRMSELEATVNCVQLRKMPDTVARYRRVKMRILRQLKTYREIVPQRLNDPDGEVGYRLRFYPETCELGGRIVEALNAEGIPCGMRGENAGPDWHVYHWMYPITTQTGVTEEGCPFTCPIYRERGGRIAYAKGDCPVADDLYDRNVSIGLNQWCTPADCDRIAAGINKVLSAFCTEAPDAAGWL